MFRGILQVVAKISVHKSFGACKEKHNKIGNSENQRDNDKKKKRTVEA